MNIILALNPDQILGLEYLIHTIFYHSLIILYLGPYLSYFFDVIPSPIQTIQVLSILLVFNTYNHKIYH